MVTGIFIGLCSCLFIISIFYIGFYYGKISQFDKKRKDKEELEQIEKEIKLRQQGLNNIMDYDIEVAMGRRKQN